MHAPSLSTLVYRISRVPPPIPLRLLGARAAFGVLYRLSPRQPSRLSAESDHVFPATDNGRVTPGRPIRSIPVRPLKSTSYFPPVGQRRACVWSYSRWPATQPSEKIHVIRLRSTLRLSVALFSDSAQPIHARPIVGDDLSGSLPESVHGRQLSPQATINHVDPAQLDRRVTDRFTVGHGSTRRPLSAASPLYQRIRIYTLRRSLIREKQTSVRNKKIGRGAVT